MNNPGSNFSPSSGSETNEAQSSNAFCPDHLARRASKEAGSDQRFHVALIQCYFYYFTVSARNPFLEIGDGNLSTGPRRHRLANAVVHATVAQTF
jgi:hypothetical protein